VGAYLVYLPVLFSDQMPPLSEEEASIVPTKWLTSLPELDAGYAPDTLPVICDKFINTIHLNDGDTRDIFKFLIGQSVDDSIPDDLVEGYLAVFKWANRVNDDLEERIFSNLEREIDDAAGLELNSRLFDVYMSSGADFSDIAVHLLEYGAFKVALPGISQKIKECPDLDLKYFFLSASYNGGEYGFEDVAIRNEFNKGDLASQLHEDYPKEFLRIREGLMKAYQNNKGVHRGYLFGYDDGVFPEITNDEIALVTKISGLEKIKPTQKLMRHILGRFGAIDVQEYLSKLGMTRYLNNLSDDERNGLAEFVHSEKCRHLRGNEEIREFFKNSEIKPVLKGLITKAWKKG
jgi:hypothetical protein